MKWPWRVCIALAAGVLANVAVAWIFPVRLDPGRSSAAVRRSWLPGVEPPEDIRLPIPPEELVPPDLITPVMISIDYIETRGPCVQKVECHIDELAKGGASHVRFVNAERLRAGWPMYSFEGTHAGSHDGKGSSSYVRGLRRAPLWFCPVEQTPNGPSYWVGYIPTRPMPGGFAADWALFAAVFFGVAFAPGMVRAFVRRRSGRCARCGYDRRGLADGGDAKCPECGGVPGCV